MELPGEDHRVADENRAEENIVEEEKTGNIIFVSAIVGSALLIFIISAIYIRDYRKYNEDKEKKEK